MNDLSAASEKFRILVADDDHVFNDLISRFLAIAGWQVRSVYDGLQAVQAARAFHPQLAILDINMPGLDGFAAAQALRADPRLADLKLVALSAATYDEHQRRCRDAGFDKQLAKPCGLATLYALVSSLAEDAAGWRDTPFYIVEDASHPAGPQLAELARRFYATDPPQT